MVSDFAGGIYGQSRCEVQTGTLDWCDHCGEWHEVGVLTVCDLHQAKEIMSGVRSSMRPDTPPKKPWTRVEKEERLKMLMTPMPAELTKHEFTMEFGNGSEIHFDDNQQDKLQGGGT